MADTAGLERTYISTMEHGKQNVTIGAVVKVAKALDTSLEQLLSSRSLNFYSLDNE